MFTRRKKIAVWLFAIALVVVLVVSIPYLFPLSRLIPSIEAQISERINQPVSIGSLRLFLLPLPYLEARTISIGKGPLLQADRVTIHPYLATILSPEKRVREIKISGLRAQSQVLGAAGALIKREASKRKRAAEVDADTLRVDRVTLRDGEIHFDDWSLSGVGAELLFDAGKLVEIRAAQSDGRLRVVCHPHNDAWQLTITARNWTVPVGVPVIFDRLDSTAVVTDHDFKTTQLSGDLYAGTLDAVVLVTWKSVWSIDGEAEVKGVDVEPLARLLNKDLAVNGRLTASPRYTSHAKDPAGLRGALIVESDFSVEKGSLQKVDLVAAARNPFDKNAGKGGRTDFDELSGHFVLNPDGHEYTDLIVASGLIRASGDLTVATNQTLDGLIEVALKGTGSLVSIPLRVTGTVDDPTLRPSRGAMAGAVAGSALLPGIGTAVGMKAGQYAEKLFGGKKKAQPDRPAAGEPEQPAVAQPERPAAKRPERVMKFGRQ